MRPAVQRAVVALLVIGLLLAGGGVVALELLRSHGSGTSAVPHGSTPAIPTPRLPAQPGATTPPDPALARFYAQRLDWSPCHDGFACARLTVPLDYRHPAGRTIELALLELPTAHPDQRLGSLVVNPGGPGAPGTEYAAQATSAFRQPLLDHYDIVGFDPRGTGASAPVDCLTDTQLDAYLASDPDPDTAAERRAAARWTRLFGRGCLARSGDLARHISTIEAARDMDVLRAALGERRLTYFGASYGTELGATYADLFPAKVGRMVLDGAVDLSIGTRRLDLEQAAGFETALRAYVADCVQKSSTCFLGSSVEQGLARIRAFLDQVDARPLPTGTDRELQAGNAFAGIALPLYSRDYWFVLSQALQQGFGGDGSALLKLSDLYSARGADGYTDNRAEAIYAISCLDNPWSIPASQVPAQIPAFEKASPTFGRVFAWMLTSCAGVRVRSTEKPRHVTAAGAPPIVVIGTSRDPATPLKWAVDLAHQLTSGVLITRDGDGHTGYNSGNACVDRAVEAYLIAGKVPPDGLAC